MEVYKYISNANYQMIWLSYHYVKNFLMFWLGKGINICLPIKQIKHEYENDRNRYYLQSLLFLIKINSLYHFYNLCGVTDLFNIYKSMTYKKIIMKVSNNSKTFITGMANYSLESLFYRLNNIDLSNRFSLDINVRSIIFSNQNTKKISNITNDIKDVVEYDSNFTINDLLWLNNYTRDKDDELLIYYFDFAQFEEKQFIMTSENFNASVYDINNFVKTSMIYNPNY